MRRTASICSSINATNWNSFNSKKKNEILYKLHTCETFAETYFCACEFSRFLPQLALPALPILPGLPSMKCNKKTTGNAINLRRQSPYLWNCTTTDYWASLLVESRCPFSGNEPATAVSPRAMWLCALGHPSAQRGTTRSGALGVPPESVPALWYSLPESVAQKW